MKKILTLIALFCSIQLIAQIKTPMASSRGSVSSVIGLTEVQINYFRPKVKDRKIFGQGDEFLVPYGTIWRTGANSGSKISFSDKVQIEGVNIEAGEYLIFTWPNENEWQVALYNDLKIGGNTTAYKQDNQVVKFKVTPTKLTSRVETLTFNISDISDDNTTGYVELTWEYTSVKFKIVSEYDTKVMKSIEENTRVNPSNLMAAARYYYDSNKDLKQALKWTNDYLSIEENKKQFWNINFKANLLQKMGDKKGALKAATESLSYAKEAPNDFGYIKLNQELIKSLK